MRGVGQSNSGSHDSESRPGGSLIRNRVEVGLRAVEVDVREEGSEDFGSTFIG